MATDVHDLLKEHTLERDRIELATGDVLDVKAGLLLVMLIFLAGQMGEVFGGATAAAPKILEWLSALSLVVGGFLSVLQLRPKKYGILSLPSKFEKWLQDLQEHFAHENGTDADVASYAERTEICQANERIEKNVGLNKRKVRLMKACFVCVMASFSANLLGLIVTHLFRLHR